MSAAFLTAPELPEVFCDRNVWPCEPLSINCPSKPENLHCFNIIQINEAFEATKLQPATHQRQHEAPEVSRRWARRLVNYFWKQLSFKNLILNINLINSIWSNLQHCDCETPETEFEFCSVKQNTVEEFEFECSRCGTEKSQLDE